MIDSSKMTKLSSMMFHSATSGELSLNDAIAQLKADANIRTTKDILMKFSKTAPEDESKLQAIVCQAILSTSSSLSKDSVRRKVSIWIKDNGAISKAAAIQLAFAFSLSYEQADELLKYTCSEGFHWRDPEDIVFGYALINHLSYQDACSLHSRMSDLGLLSPCNTPLDESNVLLTNQIQSQAMRLNCEKDLQLFLQAEQKSLGVLHNTAYSFFSKYMDILQNPAVDTLYTAGLFTESEKEGGKGSESWNALCDPDSYSIRDILSIYFHNTCIPRDTRSKKEDQKNGLVLSAIQRNIRCYWPDEITLSKMKSRTIDVNRKVLILLFVAVDGYEDLEYEDFEDEYTEEEQFEDMFGRLNQMLNSCGFAPLDTRSPFDWMILFCMCSGQKDFIDSRIEKFLNGVFDVQSKEEN